MIIWSTELTWTLSSVIKHLKIPNCQDLKINKDNKDEISILQLIETILKKFKLVYLRLFLIKHQHQHYLLL